MSDKTGIEWTDATWNPIRGCSKVSAGCRGCYAESVAARFSGAGLPYEGLVDDKGKWNGKIKLVHEHLADPLRWRRPRRIFVNSMSDLFHEGVPDDYIAAVFGVMAAAGHHTFQVLTKRPERAAKWFAWLEAMATKAGDVFGSDDLGWRRGHILSSAALRHRVRASKHAGRDGVHATAADVWPLPNVWLGVSVEDQATADVRIPQFVGLPAAVRFLSCEPLLGPIDLAYSCFNGSDSLGAMPGIDWVIAGGESGPNARPMHPDWARSLRDQCVAAGVPFFFKQWGEWADLGDAHEMAVACTRPDNARVVNLLGGHGFHGPAPRYMLRVGKRAAGREIDGREWSQFPNVGKP